MQTAGNLAARWFTVLSSVLSAHANNDKLGEQLNSESAISGKPVKMQSALVQSLQDALIAGVLSSTAIYLLVFL